MNCILFVTLAWFADEWWQIFRFPTKEEMESKWIPRWMFSISNKLSQKSWYFLKQQTWSLPLACSEIVVVSWPQIYYNFKSQLWLAPFFVTFSAGVPTCWASRTEKYQFFLSCVQDMATDKKYFRRDELAFKVALRLKFDSKRVDQSF